MAGTRAWYPREGMSWGWVLRNLKGSTSYVARSRARRGRRPLRRAAHLFPLSPSRVRTSAGSLLAGLTVPGLLLALAGMWRLPGRPGGLTSTLVVVLVVIGCLMALYAATARAPLWMRALGTACGLAYPALAILAAAGVV